MFKEFPTKFWVVVVASFIDRIGATLIMPFFALYITQKFGVGMTQAGMLIGVFSFSGLLGSMLGGALSDRFGRRSVVLFGLVASAISSVGLGLANDLKLFYLLAVGVGLLSDVAGPAWQAMIADILPEEKRSEGYGILRVVANMSWIVGPTIGGFMAGRSFLFLYIMDAITSLITAAIVYRLITETMPERTRAKKSETLLATLGGYRIVLADRMYMAYIFISMIMIVVYTQMYNTLSVYLRDVHGISPQNYGFLLTTSAFTVILCQFWVSRRVKRYPPMLMMALGSIFYMIGFGMYGFVAAYALFICSIVLITIGEMIVMPVAQALAARFAPRDMRGRYMAIFGLSWALPTTFGPTAAGLVLDNYNPNWVWYAAGILSLVASIGFSWLHLMTQRRLTDPSPEEPAPV